MSRVWDPGQPRATPSPIDAIPRVQAAVAALAALEVEERLEQLPAPEVGPQVSVTQISA